MVESLEQMSGYARFMKELVTKKRTLSYESISNLHHFSTVVSHSCMQKKDNLDVFKILCTIWLNNYSIDLSDLGVNIKLMPLVVFKQLDFGTPNQ